MLFRSDGIQRWCSGQHAGEVLIERLFGDIHGDVVNPAFAECFFDGLTQPVENSITEKQTDGDCKDQTYHSTEDMHAEHFEVLAEGHRGVIEQVVISRHFAGLPDGRYGQVAAWSVECGRISGTACEAAEKFKQLCGDGTGLSAADLSSVKTGDGNDFGGCSGQEAFVGDEDIVSREYTFDDGDTGFADRKSTRLNSSH